MNNMQTIIIRGLASLLLVFSVSTAGAGALDQALKLLTSSSFDEKSRAISLLTEQGGEASANLLRAMLDGRLYYLKQDGHVVLAQKEGDKYRLTEALSGADLGLSSKRKIKKVSINNKLRKQIKTEISRLKLSHADATKRQRAVENLMGTLDADMLG